jgi:ABC-type uncharacterized transport system permease subunit
MGFDWVSLFHDSINLSIPLVLAAFGGLVQMRGGIVNIGIEGQMLVGALSGFVTSVYFRNWGLGILGAAFFGCIVGAFTTALITFLKGNEILVGLGFNVMITGAIGYVMKSVLGISGTLNNPNVHQIPQFDLVSNSWPTPIKIILNGHDILYWFSLLLLVLVPLYLSKTKSGLRIRAIGHAAPISVAIGLPVTRIRMLSGMFAGAMAAIGGAELSLGQVGLFNLQMIAGRGFIALAAFYFGRLAPLPTAFACLVFAVFDSLQIQLQLMGYSTNLVGTLPYVMVIVALALSQVVAKIKVRKAG